MKLMIAASTCFLYLASQVNPLTVKAKPIAPLTNDDSIKVQLVRDWERAKVYTKAYLDVMPEEGLAFKPNPEIRSFAEHMLHLANANISLVSAGTGKEKVHNGQNLEKLDEYKTKAALTAVVMETYDYAISAIQGLDASKLGERVKRGDAELSRLTILNKAFEHQTHHRGQCTIYIRMKGIKPPNEMLY